MKEIVKREDNRKKIGRELADTAENIIKEEKLQVENQ